MKDPKQSLVRNIFSSWSTTLAGALIAFFLSPFLVHTLGPDIYGIWALALSVIAYTSLLDAGMKQAISRFIPKYYANQDFDNLNKVVNSAFLIYGITGTLILLVSAVIAYSLVGYLNIESEYVELASLILLLVGVNQAIIAFYIVPSACLPFHRFTITNGVELVRNIIAAILTVYFLKQGYGIIALAVITIVMTVVSSQAKTIFRNRIVPQIKYSLKYVSREKIAEMLSFGGISFLIVVTFLVIFNTDNIVIGVFHGTIAVTFYSIAGNLIGYIRVIAYSVGVPLTPLVSHMDSTSNFDEIASLYYNISKKLYYIYATVCVSLLVFGELFIFLWMGTDFGSTVKVLHILIIPMCLYLPQIPANAVLLGIGKHKQLLYILAAEAVGNIVLSIILVQKWGIEGVAWGTAIPQLIIYSFIYPWYFNKVISGKLSLFYSQLFKMVFYGTLFTLPISLLVMRYNYDFSWTGFVTNVVIVSGFITLGFYLVVLTKDEKKKITSKIRSIIGR